MKEPKLHFFLAPVNLVGGGGGDDIMYRYVLGIGAIHNPINLEETGSATRTFGCCSFCCCSFVYFLCAAFFEAALSKDSKIGTFFVCNM
jgi:hypothetical protein